jgi:ubiquinone/menaquinone biosynthesis C-methylase UbiE
MKVDKYLMESDLEALRLDIKTDPSFVEKQAKWAGITNGMRVADIGCGPGITANILHKLVQPEGETVGIDFSENRLEYARKNYPQKNLHFINRDVRESLKDIGTFDFVWVRFLLEYYLDDSFEIVKNLTDIIKPGGILCLVDLDHNCLSHYGIPSRLLQTLDNIMNELQEKANFDPYAGRKLYSYLYDLHFTDIRVDISAHHNIYGELKKSDEFNFLKKIEIAPQKINYKFKEYQEGYEEFIKETAKSFRNPRRFTYTPIIMCRGKKPIQ